MSGRWRRLAAGALLLAVTLAGWGQPATEGSKSPTLTERQKKQLEERDRLWDQMEKARTAGKLADAVALVQKVLAIERLVFGPNHEEVATTLEHLAELQRAREDYPAASKAWQEALAIRTRLHGKEHWRVTDARLALERVSFLEKLDSAARKQIEQADQASQAAARLYRQGKYGEALVVARRASQIYGKLQGETHPDYAASLNNLALVYKSVGEIGKARMLYEQARDIRKRALGEGHPDYAQSLNNLASLHRSMGDYSKALALYEQARDLREKLLGEDHLDHANSLNGLALLYEETGDHGKSLALHEQVRDIRKKALGENHPDYATSLNNLAALYHSIGDHARALALHEQARDIRKKALGENHPSYAMTLNNLAELYHSTGDHARALALHEQARDIRRKVLGENHPDYAQSLNNLAVLYKLRKEYDKALTLYEQARDIYGKALGEGHPTYATSLNNLASLHRSMGEYGKALALYEQVRDLRKKFLGESHPSHANSLNNLAAAYLNLGEIDKAARLAHQALRLRVAASDTTFAAQNSRLRLQLLSDIDFFLEGYLSLALASNASAEEIHEHVLAWKGMVAARQAEERLAWQQPHLAPLLERLRLARAALSQVSQNVPRDAKLHPQWIARLREREAEKENLETELALKSAAFRRARRATSADVAAALPPGSAFVDLLHFTHITPSRERKGRYNREPRFLAIVVRKGSKPVVIELGKAQPIDEAVATWRDRGRSSPTADASARELARLVWQPIARHVGEARSIFVSSDGSLARFPFAALPGARAETFLLEEMSIIHVTSGKHLLELTDERKDPKADGLLAVGALEFGKPAAKEQLVWSDLPGTRLEMENIVTAFRTRFPEARAPEVLSGSNIADRLRQELLHQKGPRWRYLHLATHGFFSEPKKTTPPRKKPEGPLTAEELKRLYTYERNPLLSSGLVLSGANADVARGALTAEEVMGLDLRGIDLAVLSACETGLGRVSASQGVQGLQLAFHCAGVRTLVASLWLVDDASTGVLMEQFYANLWGKKMSRGEALRQAQLTVLNDPDLVRKRQGELRELLAARAPGARALPLVDSREGASGKRRTPPAYWAAFLLSGDPGKIE